MGHEVLVVDDERAIVDLLAELLAAEGYRVRRAGDGLAALEQVERRAPDLVLTDVAMPRLSGLALTQHVQARGIPVVLMSAAVADPRLPGVPYVAKPFDLDELLRFIGYLRVNGGLTD